MKFLKSLLGTLLLCGLFFSFLGMSTEAFALESVIDKDPCEGETCFGPPPGEEIDGSINTERTFREQIIVVVNYFLTFVGLAAVVAIIYGGFLWVLSGGDEENFTKGKKIVLYAGAGIILILLSYTIVNFFISAADDVDGNTGTTNGDNGGPGTTTTNNPPAAPTDPNDLDLPPGSQINPDGTITAPNGQPYPIRIRYNPDGTITLLDADGNVILSGLIFNPDGTITFLTGSGTTVSITGGPISGNAPLTIELSGLQSRYPGQDQTIPDSAFHWSFVNREGEKVELGSGHTILHTLNESGRFVFELKIDPPADQSQLSAGIGTFSIEVLGPRPNVGFSINGSEARLFQQFSLAEAGNGLTFTPLLDNQDTRRLEEFAWNFGDGTPILRSNQAETVTHIFSRNGDFEVTLSVTDNLGKTNRKSVTVSIADLVSRMNISPTERFVGDQITFNANGSNSSFGNIIETRWRIIDAAGESEEITSANFVRSFENAGNVSVTLTVTDSSGKTAVTSETIAIRSHTPKANFSSQMKSQSEPATFVFNGGLSSDIDDDPLNYSWDFQNDGSFEVTASANSRTEFTFSEPGTYDVRLQVKDDSGETNETVQKVEVRSVLNVNFTADRFVAHPNQEIRFVAQSPNAITYFWDFGDDTSTQGASSDTTHNYNGKGKYTVTLTAFDQNDNENSATRTVYIGEKDMPVAVFEVNINNIYQLIRTDHCGNGKNGVTISRADMVTFDGSQSINRDGENSGLEYEWIFHDGTFSRDQIVRKRFDETPDEGECFPVRLTVRDEDGGKTATAETVWVKIANAAPQMDALQVSIPENKVAPVIVPLKVQNPRDPDGQIIEYKWWAYRPGENQKIGLHTTTIPSTSIILPVHGLPDEANRYLFVVELRDNLGSTINSEEIFGKTNFVEVTNGENRSPIVDFRVEKTSLDEGDTNTFFADASDPLGSTIPDSAYMWDFNGDNVFDAIGTGPQVTHRFEQPGEFEVRLKVVHRGLSSSKTRSVFVARKHEVPKAAFSYKVQGHNVLFDAANSAVDDTIANNTKTYQWDFDTNVDSDGDGDPANDVDSTDVRTRHFYEEFGTRSVKLVITDRLGVQDEVIRSIPVVTSGQVVSGSESASGMAESIRLQANQPLTTLDLILQQSALSTGESTTLLVFVKNADGTLFNGEVQFAIISGSATLSNSSAQAVLGESAVDVTAGSPGKAVIQVTAKNTVSGDITELIALEVE